MLTAQSTGLSPIGFADEVSPFHRLLALANELERLESAAQCDGGRSAKIIRAIAHALPSTEANASIECSEIGEGVDTPSRQPLEATP
jgi:hypothetical protein